MKETLVTQIEAGQAEDGYRYKHFTVPLLLRDMRYSGAALKPGQKIPNSTIFGLDGNQISVNELGTNKPILLVTGSLTCPMTASSMPTLMRLFREFGAEVDFVTLNVREAHPGENVPQPGTSAEKIEHARGLRELYDIPWPVVVDDIDGSLHKELDAKPNTAYLIDSSGEVLFRSLWARDESAIGRALATVSGGSTLAKRQSVSMVPQVMRAIGYVKETMDRAGPQAHRDLVLSAPPMEVAGRMADLLRPLPRDYRGPASMLVIVAATAGIIAGLIAAFM